MAYHEISTSTFSLQEECWHANGWFDIIDGWIFDKAVFCCCDCMRIIPLKEYKQEITKQH